MQPKIVMEYGVTAKGGVAPAQMSGRGLKSGAAKVLREAGKRVAPAQMSGRGLKFNALLRIAQAEAGLRPLR